MQVVGLVSRYPPRVRGPNLRSKIFEVGQLAGSNFRLIQISQHARKSAQLAEPRHQKRILDQLTLLPLPEVEWLSDKFRRLRLPDRFLIGG
jgi:hypothetical protein